MSDLDDELLAMAGDDDSDSGSEAGDAADRKESDDPRSPRSPSEEAKPSVEKKEEPAPSRTKGVATKVKRGRGGKKKSVSKRELEDELLDLGDSASEPASPRAGSVGGSDDEEDAPGSPEDEGPIYPVDGKFLSEQDKREILDLPEIERESILAERAQEVLKKQQDLQLKKALASAQATANKHKRKAAAAELEDGGSKRGAKKPTALDNYKAVREARGTDRASRVDRKNDRKDDRSPSSASDRDADGESEVEWADTTAKSEPPADLKDFERCRIGRSNFAKVFFYPNFEDTIKGCFTRVSIGINRETGQNMYRMAQIKGFRDGKPYSMEDHRGRPYQIDQYAIVAQGSSEKPWPFHACSDGKFTLEEFQRYHATMEKENLRVPRKSWLEHKLQDIHNFLNIAWDNGQITAKFAKMDAMKKKLDPANIARAKREGIEKRRVEAEKEGDEEELAKCEAELAALENGAMNGASGLKSKPSPLKAGATTQTASEKLAALNARNRGKTSEDVRKALLAERRKVQMEREKAYKDAKAAKEAKAAEEAKAAALLAVPKDDLFGDTPDGSRAGTPTAGTPKIKRSRAGTPVDGAGGKKPGGGLGLGRRKMEEEVLDLGIEVDI